MPLFRNSQDETLDANSDLWRGGDADEPRPRVKARRVRQRDRVVAIGLTGHDLTLVVLERGLGDSADRVRHRHVQWRFEASDLQSEQGQAELKAAVAKLGAEEKLQGVPIHLALSSDFCVTRVISGESEQVRRELSQVLERSQVYLSLGVGSKIAAVTESAIDARRRHAWVSVANRQIIETIYEAFDAARLNLVRIEHTVAALSRVVQATGDDADTPVIVIDVCDNGVDVAISHRGNLLLDYRPSGTNARECVGTIVGRHTKRLQRYIDRLLRGSSAPIGKICVCGESEDMERVCWNVIQQSDLPVRELRPACLPCDWELDAAAAEDSSLTADLGMLLEQTSGDLTNEYPNLLEPLRDTMRRPVAKTLLKIGWPVVATLVMSVLLALTSVVQGFRSGSLERELAAVEQDTSEVEDIRFALMSVQAEIESLEQMRKGLTLAPWSRMMTRVGHCLPSGVWLNEFRVTERGDLELTGTSHSEDAVFVFVEHLRTVPDLAGVSLESTQQTVRRSGPALRFSVMARVAASEKQPDTLAYAAVFPSGDE